jgi:hypothetical protein
MASVPPLLRRRCPSSQGTRGSTRLTVRPSRATPGTGHDEREPRVFGDRSAAAWLSWW